MVYGLIAATGMTPLGGCGLLRKVPPSPHDTKMSYHDDHGLQIEYPEVTECASAPALNAELATEPLTLEDPADLPTLELSLEQAVQLAVQQSAVLRSIGGTVVNAPQGTATIYEPSLVAASPVLGTEAALSAFDAQYTQQLFWNNQDQPSNVRANNFGVPNVARGKIGTFNAELSKLTATGGSFALRHIATYDRTNRFAQARSFRAPSVAGSRPSGDNRCSRVPERLTIALRARPRSQVNTTAC